MSKLPALVVMYGTTSRRRRPLVRTVTLLGKSRQADIRLDAPEISVAHCIIAQERDGMVVRDCDSRTGTLVNGQPIKETTVKDGDTLQIGPFSFKLSIPEVSPVSITMASRSAADGARELAMKMASVEQEAAKLKADRTTLDLQAEEIERKLAALAAREKSAGQGSGASDKELDAKLADLTFRQQELERNLVQSAARERQLERTVAESASRENELQRRIQESEKLGAKLAVEKQQLELDKSQWLAAARENSHSRMLSDAPSTQVNGSGEPSPQRLQEIREEIFAQEVRPLTETIDNLQVEIQRLRAENGKLHDQVDSIRQGGDTGLKNENAELTTFAAELDKQVTRLKQELDGERKEAEFRINSLKQELDSERKKTKDYMREAAGQFTKHQQEMTQLRQSVEMAQAELAQYQDPSQSSAMQQEIEALRDMVNDLQSQLAESQQRSTMPEEVKAYEEQLNGYREQLEEAQQQLVKHEGELNEKSRQTEMQLSRERAEMAREKATLDRVRQELKAELERAERDAKNLEKMSGVHRLASEMRQQGRAAQVESDDSNSLSGRIRGLFKKLGE